MAAESPLWRKAFDGVERRIGAPLENATSSADFQVLSLKVGRVKTAVIAPVEAVVGFGLHLVGIRPMPRCAFCAGISSRCNVNCWPCVVSRPSPSESRKIQNDSDRPGGGYRTRTRP